MATTNKKKWTVITNRNVQVTIEAERAKLDESHARVTFYNGDEDGQPVASFVGFAGYFPATSEVSE